MMDELLRSVLDAHGGMDQWNAYHTVEASIVTGGEFWGIKGLMQDASVRRMTVALHKQRASLTPFGAPGQRTDYSRERIIGELSADEFLARLKRAKEST